MTQQMTTPEETATRVTTPQLSSRRSRRDRKQRRRSTFPPLRGLLPLVVFLAVWQAFGSPDSPYYPPPSTWWTGLMMLWDSDSLVPAILSTLETFAVSLIIATVLGALIGTLIGASRLTHRALNPTLEFARSMPSAAVVPIAVLLIGYNQQMKIAVVIFAAIWPIMLNTLSAMRTLNPILLDTASSLHLSRLDRARKIIFPSLLPAVLLGVRVAAPITLIVTLLVEILTAVSGVGALIATAQRNFQSPAVFGLIIVAGLFGLLVNGIVAAIEGYVFRYRSQR